MHSLQKIIEIANSQKNHWEHIVRLNFSLENVLRYASEICSRKI